MKPLLCSLSLLCTCVLAAQTTYFPPITGNEWQTMSLEEAGLSDRNEADLNDFLVRTNTDAFLLLKDGKIVIERYFGNFTSDSPHLWNSAGKSLTAFAVGIAAEIDALDLDDPTADYLGQGWTNCPETEPRITIRNQLSMTSGLSDLTGEFGCTDPSCLVCLAEPGERWAYHNGPYTLLGAVIESATDKGLNEFVRERIHQATGMTGRYLDIGDNRVYGSTARSMARFGILVQNKGSWDGQTVLADTAYVEAMTNSSQELNPAYGYLWWLNGKESFLLPSTQFSFSGPILPNAPADVVAAIGKNGQILNLAEREGLVLVRMGGNPEDGSLVSTQYNDSLWVYVNALRETTSVTERSNNRLRLSPNPANDSVSISSEESIMRIQIFSGGRLAKKIQVDAPDLNINLNDLPTGVLSVRIEFISGDILWRRLVHKGM